MVAVVGSREYILKSRGFLYATSWLRHCREVPSRLKRRYLRRFRDHYPRIAVHLLLARAGRDVLQLVPLVESISPSVTLVDDKLMKYFKHIDTVLVPDKSTRYTHHKRLMLIADNLANYFRVVLKDNPRRFREELRRFEK